MDITKCSNCGAGLRYYHSDGITRIVCEKKCQGWKILQEIDRRNIEKDNDYKNSRKIPLYRGCFIYDTQRKFKCTGINLSSKLLVELEEEGILECAK